MKIELTTTTQIAETIINANHIYLIGDGGSAALADHFACDLLKNCRLPAISLCSNAALLTAIGNDHSFHEIFSLQVQRLWREGDILLIFSTSGGSENLIQAASIADHSIAFLGRKGRIIDAVGFKRGSGVFSYVILEAESQMKIENCMLEYCHSLAYEIMSRKAFR